VRQQQRHDVGQNDPSQTSIAYLSARESSTSHEGQGQGTKDEVRGTKSVHKNGVAEAAIFCLLHTYIYFIYIYILQLNLF